MDFSSDPISTIGLRHIIEDGVRGLEKFQSGENDGSRTKFAIERINQFLSSALRGAEMTTSRWHQVQSGDMGALETYSKMFDYFYEAHQERLPDRLKEVSAVLSDRLSGNDLDETRVENALSFLQELLEKIRKDALYKKHSEPSLPQLRRSCP